MRLPDLGQAVPKGLSSKATYPIRGRRRSLACVSVWLPINLVASKTGGRAWVSCGTHGRKPPSGATLRVVHNRLRRCCRIQSASPELARTAPTHAAQRTPRPEVRFFTSRCGSLRRRSRRCMKRKMNGGEGGIRTHVPGLTDHPISSRRRCDRFGTSPQRGCYSSRSLRVEVRS